MRIVSYLMYTKGHYFWIYVCPSNKYFGFDRLIFGESKMLCNHCKIKTDKVHGKKLNIKVL